MQIKNNGKLLLSIFAALSCTALFGQSDEIKIIDGARTQMKEAFDSFKNAETTLDSASRTLSSEWILLKSESNYADSLNLELKRLSQSSANLDSEISKFKIAFASDVENFKSAKAILENVSKTTPFAKTKIARIEALIESLRKEVALNPGNLYQDKNYFDILKARFTSAVARLNSAQESLNETLVNISVATPKIEGVVPALKLADEYMAKLKSLNSDNSDKLASVIKPLKELDSKYFDDQKIYATAAESANKSAEKLKIAYGKLTEFMLNTIANSPKFKDADFTQIAIFKSPNSISADFVNYGKSEGTPFENSLSEVKSTMLANKNRAKAASFWNHESGSEQKNVRKEFLGKFAVIENASFEISEAADFIYNIVSSAQTQSEKIDVDIFTAQGFSMRAISLFSNAQKMQSQIQKTSTTVKVLDSRAKIFKDKFSQLLKNADAKILDAAKKADESAATLESLKSKI